MNRILPFLAAFSLMCFASGTVGQTNMTLQQPATQLSVNNLSRPVPKSDAARWLQKNQTGFIENKGQLSDQNGRSNKAVKYLLNMPGLNVQLRATGFSYDTWVLDKKKETETGIRKYHRVDIELEGAHANAVLTSDQPLTEADNVINEHGAFEGIRSFGKVTYRNIYPGIDLEFVARKGTDKPVEYNFIVHPGADASQIKMRYNSGSDITLRNNMIEMDLAFGKLKEKIPASYTQQDGQSLAVHYKAEDELKNLYAFHIPNYDKRKTLVIDPTPSLVWATYYGGTGTVAELVSCVDVDDAGNIYIGGNTNSTAGIATTGTHRATFSGGVQDMYVAKFTAAGVRLWATYYGGATTSTGAAGATQTFGKLKAYGTSVYFHGYTNAAGLASAGTFRTTIQGNLDIILVRLNGANGTRMWATYFGGNATTGFETPYTLAVDAAGNTYFGGETESTAGIASAGAYQTVRSGTNDGFLAKFNASGGRVWSTYIGGPGTYDDVFGTAVDASGNVYVSGYTNSTSAISTAGSFQPAFAGGAYDMYLIKLNSTGTTKIWGTYWGGDLAELNRGLEIGPDGNLVMGGMTGQITNPEMSNGLASTGTYQTAPVGGRDIVFAKFTPDGNRLWATYYGGTASEFIGTDGFDLDESGNILFVGDGLGRPIEPANPPSSTLATPCTYQPDLKGDNDVFVGKLSADGTTRIWGTYFGGTARDRGYTLAYAGNGNFLIGGSTLSNSGIATAGAHKTALSGTSDGWVARFNEGLAPSDVKVTTTTLSPMSQTGCALGIPATITGNAVSLYNPPGFTSAIFYQWQVADAATGPWTDLPGEVFKDLQPQASQTAKYYRRMILVNSGYCDKVTVDSSAVAEVLVNSNTAPIANADGPQWYVCGAGANTLTLNGSASGGSGVYSTYQWYAGSNLTTPVASTANYTPTVTTTTTYTLKVTDNAGCVDLDQVTVTPAIANAGPNVSYCQNSGGVQIGTTGIPGGNVAYAWTTVSGSPVTSLSCTDCAQPVAKPTANTTYRVTTTVTRKGGITCSTTDDVVVTLVAAPTGGASFGGTDKSICKGSTVVLGGVNDAAATYSWSPVSYLSASNVFNPTFNAGTNKVQCPMVYTVTATKGGCTFTDQVSVTVIDASTSLDNQTVICEGWSSGNTNNCAGATYTWQLVSGPGAVPTGQRLRNGGADAYLVNTGASNAVYRRVTTVNGINCNSANITISPCSGGDPSTACPAISIAMMSPQGCPKVFGSQELQLRVNGINAADYNFSWSPANIMDNPTAPTVTVTSTAPATVNVTVTNKYTGLVCTAPGMPINNPAWSLPVLNVSDKSTCPGTPVGIGEPTASGFTYAWLPQTNLNAANIGNPVATLTNSAFYNVVKTDNASGCKATADVSVTVRAIDFDAGADRAICNGATATLGTTPGAVYTYSWTPTNAAWTNGTGPTDANPQVLFAGSSQTFNVTITDPATGCQKTDAVTLRGSVQAGEYAGAMPSPPLCPGETVQLGSAAIPNATYAWSPATGLSCTNCADPVATAGAADQTYTVEVSYPGCTTPVTDQVTVPVVSLPNVVLTDKTVCSTTPTNIGIGGAGNTASLANVSKYEWSPATGLSCTNCASPNANPVAVTTYTVVITFTSGCTLEREVTVTPSVTATAKPDATICPGGSVVLGSPATSDVTYSWTVVSGTAGSVSPANAAQPTANPTATTVYRLTATGTGPKAGCTVTDNVQVTVKALPAFNITGNTSVCTGGIASLAVSPVTPNTTYQWSPLTGVASPDSSHTTIMPAATTTYRVTQTDINSGCSNYKEVVVSVHPNNVLATGGDITVCPASSATMPLTVSPSSGNTVAWSPAAYLDNPYAQNPTITPQAGGTYIATVTNNTTSCSDTALVTVTVPESCLGADFGDAPLVYEKGDPAKHDIVATLKIGSATDAEGLPVSNALASGDDNNSQINDEEGISFLPAPTTASRSLGLVVNDVLNNSGNTAFLVAWIDFNRDGDFEDAGEQSQIASLPTGTASSNPVLQFSNFNAGCLTVAGPSYLRIRLTTDQSGGWNTSPSPVGARTDGEVEDYSILIAGSDFGDAPAVYPAVKAMVNPDLDLNGEPDATGSVWLGTVVDYSHSCGYAASWNGLADDNDFTTIDEDGLNTNGGMTPNTTKDWHITVNSQGPVSNVQWGMWIDWDADGVFDEFRNGSENTASPVVVPVSVTSPAGMVPNYLVRLGVKTGTAFTSDDFSYPISNGEWEDYISPGIPLPVTLLSFQASKSNNTSLLKWETSMEENSDHFVIERSADGQHYEETGRLAASVNSSVTKQYVFTDYQPLPAINYYRLKMVDKDGRVTFSPVRLVDFRGVKNYVSIVPNPAYGVTRLVFAKVPAGSVRITITNNLGQPVQSFTASGISTQVLNLAGLAQGVYHVSVKGKDIDEQMKLVVQ